MKNFIAPVMLAASVVAPFAADAAPRWGMGAGAYNGQYGNQYGAGNGAQYGNQYGATYGTGAERITTTTTTTTTSRWTSLPDTSAPYVSARIGVTDFIVNTHQYTYASAGSPLSTIVDGRVKDINATYHAALGYRFDRLRADAEFSYGYYSMGGNWAVLDKSPIEYLSSLVFPGTYGLTDSVFTVLGNLHYDIFRFGRQYEREMYTRRGDTGHVLTFNALYLTGGIGVARISERGKVSVDIGAVWPGGTVNRFDATATDTRFTYSLGGGMAVGLAPHVDLDIEYRYTNMGKMSADMVSRKYYSHELSAGLRYTF